MSESKIRWGPFWSNPVDSLAGYLDGEEGTKQSYSIRFIQEDDRLIFRLSGPGLSQSALESIDFPDPKAAKAYAEELEINR